MVSLLTDGEKYDLARRRLLAVGLTSGETFREKQCHALNFENLIPASAGEPPRLE
jgi:hypothetical protein